MVAKFVVLIFASLLLQNEACTRLLQRLQQMSQTQIQQPLRRTDQMPATTNGASPISTLQTSQTPISRSENYLGRPYPAGSSTPNVLQAQSRSPYARSINNGKPPNYMTSNENWDPNFLYSSSLFQRNPSNINGSPSGWNVRQFNAAFRPPGLDSSSDVPVGNTMTDAKPRSLVSGLMNTGTGLLPGLMSPLSSSLSRLPSDLNDVTRDVTTSLSGVTPTISSTLSNIPKAANSLSSGVTSTVLSPFSYFPTSALSSIPGLLYLSSLFSNWMNSNSTDPSTRSNSSSYNLMSYIPGLLSVISVIAPFLPSWTPSPQSPSTRPRSPLSAITNLPSSILGLTGLSPYGYEQQESNRRGQSGSRPSGGQAYYGGDYSNEYQDGREDYAYNDRYQSSRNKQSTAKRLGAPSGQNRRSDRHRNRYDDYESDYQNRATDNRNNEKN